jgi:mRNA interferase RelE/StbE
VTDVWRVEMTPAAAKQIASLSPDVRKRIGKAIVTRLLPDPKRVLIPLAGPLRGYGKFRVGDYRLLCLRDDGILRVLVVEVGHRSDIYR